MRNITGLTLRPASDYAESGCKGTKYLISNQIIFNKFFLSHRFFPMFGGMDKRFGTS